MAIRNLTINQIFKGVAPSQYFGVEGTYDSAIAIDPDLPIISTGVRTSGFLVPVGSAKFSNTDVTGTVIREITHPKDNNLWTIQTNGKITVYNAALATETALGTVAGSNATWGEYYNNFIFVFGTGTLKDDVTMVGPLNTLPFDGQTVNFTVGLTVTGGTSGATGVIISQVDGGATGTLTLSNITGIFVDNETITDTSGGSAAVNRSFSSLITNNVWKGATLGSQTALNNTTYPVLRGVSLPNHVAHVHGDGSMYFCDFANGQGLLHRINTKKGTNEGDTNGTTVPSIYNALDLPFGFYPTSVESYGANVFITGIYTVDSITNQGKSAFIIWNPTNTESFDVGPVFLSDPLATASLNVNGLIYLWTGNSVSGVRLSLYDGGNSVRELVFQEDGLPPFAGAVDALGNRVVWGGFSTYPTSGAVVWAFGSKNAQLPTGLHCVTKTSSSGLTPNVTALRYVQQSSNITPKLVVSWKDASTQGIDKYSTSATLASSFRYLFNLGVKFNILRVSFPLAGSVASGTTITPTIYFDNLSSSKSLATINNTNYPSKRKVIYKGSEMKDFIGQNDFLLDLSWTGTDPLPVGLPIVFTIDIHEDEAT